MERIHYAGSSFLTGDAIARALVDFARFLAAHNNSAVVDIPVRHTDGSLARANFLLVPTSQLVSESEDSPYGEIVDDDLVRELEERTSGERPTQPWPALGAIDRGFDSFTYSDFAEFA
jgi:hypothetical protein